MKNPKSTNRLFELDQQLESERQSPPPPTESSTSGSGSLFNLDKAVGKPNQPLQPRNHPSPPSPSGSGFLFDLDQSVAEPNQPTQSQNHPPQIRSFDDGSPIEMVTAEEDNSPMEAQAFDFNEPIVVQEENYTKASSWDEDYTEASPWDEDYTTASSGKDYTKEMATGSVPFEATNSFEPEQQVSYAAESPKETSSHAEGLAQEMEVLRQKVRSIEQPAASTTPSSPDSEVLGDRLQDIRNEIKQLQWQKQQQPKGNTEAIADQIKAIREELQSLRQSREDEHLSQEDWEALELEPTFQDFDQKIDEEQSPSKLEAAHYAPVEVVPPEAPHPQARAMEVGLSQQFAEFDRMMDEETTDAIELAEGLEYGSGIGSEQYASQLGGVETIDMYLDADRTGISSNNINDLLQYLVKGNDNLNKWEWGEKGKGAIILYQSEKPENNENNNNDDENKHDDSQQEQQLNLAPLVFYPKFKDDGSHNNPKLEGRLEWGIADDDRIQLYTSIKPNASKIEHEQSFGVCSYTFDIPKEGLILGMVAKRYDLIPGETPITLEFIPIIDDESQEEKKQTAEILVAPWMMPHVLCPVKQVYVGSWKDKLVQNFTNILNKKFNKKKVFPINLDLPKKHRFVQDAVEIGYSYAPKNLRTVSLRSPINSWHSSKFKHKFLNEILPKDLDKEVNITTKGNTMSFGNLEVTPPLPKYPFGRIYYSAKHSTGNFFEEYANFLKAQKVQKPFTLDASWLYVGHVDELVCFLPVRNKLVACIPSPRKAIEIIKEVQNQEYEATLMKKRKLEIQPAEGEKSVEIDVSKFKNGETIGGVEYTQIEEFNFSQVDTNRKDETENKQNTTEEEEKYKGAQQYLDEVALKLRKELGNALILIEVPVLFYAKKWGKQPKLSALTSNLVNLLAVNDLCFFPKPYGPTLKWARSKFNISNIVITHKLSSKEIKITFTTGTNSRQDVFEQYMLTMLNHFKLKGIPCDVWDLYHMYDGEIHCGTNTWRTPDKIPQWWTLFE